MNSAKPRTQARRRDAAASIPALAPAPGAQPRRQAKAAASADLAALLRQQDIAADAGQIDALHHWLELLDRWNRVHNLTGLRDPAARVERLVLDSAATLPFLRPPRVLDVGSGAGVPGMVVAVLRPDCECVMIDAVGKKAAFIAHCIEALGLDNARAVHARAEDFAAPPFDTVVARAFGPLERFLQATRRLAGDDALRIVFRAHSAPPAAPDPARWQCRHIDAPGGRDTLALTLIEARRGGGREAGGESDRKSSRKSDRASARKPRRAAPAP